MPCATIYRNSIKANGLDLFYLDTRGQGPVILCLHGRWGRAETWIEFMKQYGDRYRIIAPDQRGHGLTSKPVSKYTAEEMASDIVALLEKLKIESIIVVGHSMGGHIAGYLAAMHPEYIKALAILDKSANGPDTPSPLALNELTNNDPITKSWPLPFTSRSEAQDYIKTAMESELSYHYFMSSLVETVEGYEMMFSEQAINANIAYYTKWFDLLPRVHCPVMLVRARGGQAVPDDDFRKMQNLIPDCLSFDMEDSDHNVHLANKEEFYGYFDKFLKEKVFSHEWNEGRAE
jgi:pimeloyl-ACP methyl ester carboxylesterase